MLILYLNIHLLNGIKLFSGAPYSAAYTGSKHALHVISQMHL